MSFLTKSLTLRQLVLGFSAIVLLIFGYLNRPPDPTPKRLTAADSSSSRADAPVLEAAVYFDGLRFGVRNNSPAVWSDVSLTVDTLYRVKLGSIVAGDVTTIGAANLVNHANAELDVFNPFTMTPKTATVEARLPDGSWRSFVGSPQSAHFAR